MKLTNIKQFIIKFMGGGIINFPTRFLHWVKINGDSDDSDDGDEDNVDINTILDNISVKDDLLTKLQPIDYTNQDENGVLTDFTLNDIFNDYDNFIEKIINRENNKNINVINFSNNLVLEKGDDYWQIYIFVDNNTSYSINIISEEEIRVYKTSVSSE